MIESIGWSFGKCNMNCKDCYHASAEQAPEYSYNSLVNIADKICPTIKSINYGGGEFLYNPCALAIAEYIKEKYPNIKQGLTTNGFSSSFIDARKLKRIFHDIDISIDFPDPERQKEFRGHPKAWDWAIGSLKICRELGIETSITTCITSQTSDRDIIQLLHLAFGFGASWRCSWFRKTGRGKEKYCLSAKRFWEIIKLLAREKVIFEAIADPLLAGILKKGGGDSKGCKCGTSSCRIQTDLTVTPCVFLKGEEWSGGSLLESNLDKIFNSNSFCRIRERKPEFCLKCEFWDSCQGGCPARAYLHSGGLDQPDDYCPLRNKLAPELWQNIQIDHIKHRVFDKVHSGYLCTLIVKPKP